jgi:aldehyde:ferredoxin oxidoreductase
MAVGAKSPLTGGIGAAEVGGFWGTELKQAGWDAVVVEGAAPSPVYLWIRDDQVELQDASHLWGQKTKETQDGIRVELGDPRIRCTLIGPGGENQVRYANVMNGLYDAAGRTGLGAVMGSKNLKAIAVRGTGKVRPSDGDRLKEIARDLAEAGRNIGWLAQGTGSNCMDFLVDTGNLPIRNFRDGGFPNAMNLDGATLLEAMGGEMDGCFACSVRCKKTLSAEEPYPIDPAYGGPEYESIASLGSACGVDDGPAMAKAAEMCNAYSLDTISTGVTIAFAMECFENGLLTLEDTGGVDLRFGNGEALVAMVEQIAHRKGLGATLAEGPARAAEQIGGDAARFAIHVKNQPWPAHEPRLKKGLTFGYAVSPTGADHIQGMQDHALSLADPSGFLADPVLRSMGVLEPMSGDDLGPAKVRASVYYSMSIGLLNSLCFCLFVQLGTGMTLDQEVDMVRAATGWDVTAFELLKAGERANTLARLFNMREGLTAEDDRLPERAFEPTVGGPLSEVRIDRDDVDEAVHTYYAMMGWDRETGVPLPWKLQELDVPWAVVHLPS